MFDCCLYSEGAAALILASEDRAREICDDPIWIEGAGASNLRSYMPDFDHLGRLPCQRQSARRAYSMAGISDPLRQLDFIETHDLLSGVELMSYAELGLCEPGQGGRLIDEGFTGRSGPMPVNPSGGMIGCGHVARLLGHLPRGRNRAAAARRAGGTQYRSTRGGRSFRRSADWDFAELHHRIGKS